MAVTTQTAARFGLHPGSRLVLTAPLGPVELAVTAVVAERDAGSTFWTQDITVGMPSFVTPGSSTGWGRCWRILVRWRPYRTHSGCRGWRWSGSSRCGWGA